jgi:imidazolonepropionase-like amidohydrolase
MSSKPPVRATGGHMTSGPSLEALSACQFSVSELRAAAGEAHLHGLPITAHAHGRDGIIAAREAGFDGVEHASFLTPHGPGPDPQIHRRPRRQRHIRLHLHPSHRCRYPLPPVIAAFMEVARTLMRAMVGGGARIIIGPDAGIAPQAGRCSAVRDRGHGGVPGQRRRPIQP